MKPFSVSSIAALWLVDPVIALGDPSFALLMERVSQSSMINEANLMCSAARFMLIAMCNRSRLAQADRLLGTPGAGAGAAADLLKGKFGIGSDYFALPPSFGADSAVSGRASLALARAPQAAIGASTGLTSPSEVVPGLAFGDITGLAQATQRALTRWDVD